MATESTNDTLDGTEKNSNNINSTSSSPPATTTAAPTTGAAVSTAATSSTTTSNIIFIRNLVRPFTLVRLKELLEKTGKLVEDQFWIDKIKSKCYATYEKEEDAINTREALNGTSWPDANPKKLAIEFATQEELDYHLNLDKNPPVSGAPTAPPSSLTSSSSSSRARTIPENVNDQKENAKKEINNEKFDAVIRRGKLDKLDPEPSKDIKESNRQDGRGERPEKEKRPIREWDKEKFSANEKTVEEMSPIKKKRPNSASPETKGRRNRDSQPKEKKDRKYRGPELDDNIMHREDNMSEIKSPAKLLDDLYKKTKATPCIYWLPLGEEQAKKRAEIRAENVKKREEEQSARKSRIEKQRPRRRTPPSYNKRRTPSPYNKRRTLSPYKRRTPSPAYKRRTSSPYSSKRRSPSPYRRRI